MPSFLPTLTLKGICLSSFTPQALQLPVVFFKTHFCLAKALAMAPPLSVLVTLTSLRFLLKSYLSHPFPLSNLSAPNKAREECVYTTAHPWHVNVWP